MSQKVFGIDFGTQTIKIYKKAQGIILNEKSVVATGGKESIAIAVGDEAFDMYEKAPDSIRVTFPLIHGAVAHMEDMVALWNYAFGQIANEQKMKSAEFHIAVPCDITEVEKRAFYDVLVASKLKIKKAVLIDKPVADAVGIGLDVNQCAGAMIVNMGADTTEISIISLGGIVLSKLLPIGGNTIDKAIRTMVNVKEHFSIGSKTAETIKIFFSEKYQPDAAIEIKGRSIIKGLPDKKQILGETIYPLMEDYIHAIEDVIKSTIERTPPEISTDIIEDGVYLTGGSSCICGIDTILEKRTGLKMNLCKNAQTTVIDGIGKMIEQPKYATYYLSKNGSMTITK